MPHISVCMCVCVWVGVTDALINLAYSSPHVQMLQIYANEL